MSNSAEKTLYRKAVLIFEELGFLMPRSEGGGYSDEAGRTATVAFKGAFSGRLAVFVSSGLLPQLSANMLAEQKSPSRKMEEDALCEIANIICGNVLPAIYGYKPIFNLDAPTVVQNPAVDLDSTYPQVAEAHILFDGGQADVTLYAEQNGPADS